MAIAIRGTTPATTITTSNPMSLTLTGARQPNAGDVLLIIHGNDFYALSNMPTPTVGGSTTGVNAVSGGSSDAGTNHGHIKAYTYVVGSTGDLTVSVTETGAGDEDKCLAVYVLSGVDTSTPTDGAAGNFNISATTTHDAPSVSPGTSNAFLICHDNSGGGSSASSYTPPSGMTETYDAQVGGISHTGATLQLSASGATGTKTFTPSGSVEYATITVAMRTASAGAAPTFVAQPARRRPSAAPVRDRPRVSTPVRAQVNPPYPTAFDAQPRRLRGLRPRRAQIVTPVPAQVVVTALNYPPQPERIRIKALRLFRARIATPAVTQAVPLPQPARSRFRGVRLFRPRTAAPIPAQVVVAAPAYPPQGWRTRIRGLRLFRPRAAGPTPDQVVVVPPGYPPQPERARVIGRRLDRPRIAGPVPTQATPAPPVFVPQPDPRPRLKIRPLRSHAATPPPAQAAPPLFERIRTRVARAFRGRTVAPVPPQVVLIAPGRAPQPTKARRLQFHQRRHRGGVEGWMVGGTHLCIITRPTTGTTGHTVTLTARPDTGITEDPC